MLLIVVYTFVITLLTDLYALNTMKKIVAPATCCCLCICQQKEYNADLLVKNAVVYTVDSNFTTADAFVVKGGKIVAVGKPIPSKKI